jgi:hypothetical protein
MTAIVLLAICMLIVVWVDTVRVRRANPSRGRGR